jgi:hypothetical protein
MATGENRVGRMQSRERERERKREQINGVREMECWTEMEMA